METYFDKIYFLLITFNVYDLKLEHLLVLKSKFSWNRSRMGVLRIKFPSRANTGMKGMTLNFRSLPHSLLYKYSLSTLHNKFYCI